MKVSRVEVNVKTRKITRKDIDYVPAVVSLEKPVTVDIDKASRLIKYAEIQGWI